MKKKGLIIGSIVLCLCLCIGGIGGAIAASVWRDGAKSDGNTVKIGSAIELTLALEDGAINAEDIYPGATVSKKVTVDVSKAEDGKKYSLVLKLADTNTADAAYWTVSVDTGSAVGLGSGEIISEVETGEYTLNFKFSENAPESESGKMLKFVLELKEVEA